MGRTYHTRKEVAELIFKVIDSDGTDEAMFSNSRALMQSTGSGLVAQEELTDALRHFGNQKSQS
jgi:hypothetical protein